MHSWSSNYESGNIHVKASWPSPVQRTCRDYVTSHDVTTVAATAPCGHQKLSQEHTQCSTGKRLSWVGPKWALVARAKGIISAIAVGQTAIPGPPAHILLITLTKTLWARDNVIVNKFLSICCIFTFIFFVDEFLFGKAYVYIHTILSLSKMPVWTEGSGCKWMSSVQNLLFTYHFVLQFTSDTCIIKICSSKTLKVWMQFHHKFV
jgi:hypothetical protein